MNRNRKNLLLANLTISAALNAGAALRSTQNLVKEEKA